MLQLSLTTAPREGEPNTVAFGVAGTAAHELGPAQAALIVLRAVLALQGTDLAIDASGQDADGHLVITVTTADGVATITSADERLLSQLAGVLRSAM
jgi:hypothetical protein